MDRQNADFIELLNSRLDYLNNLLNNDCSINKLTILKDIIGIKEVMVLE